MRGRHIAAVFSLTASLAAVQASAQTTRGEQIDTEKAARAADVQPESRETGDLIVTRFERLFMPEPPALRLTFGDFRPGGGLALGAGYGIPLGERGLWTGAAAASVNSFKELETAVDIPPTATDRIHVRAVAKWDDAPDLRFFGLGTASTLDDEVGYGLRSTETGGDVRGRGPRWFAYGASATYLRIQASAGTGEVPAAGPSTSEVWWHTTASAAFDTRQAPGYTTTGALYRIAFHDYAGRPGAPSFTRTEVDLRQFIPVLHNNWIIALQARADMTSATSGHVVPFFLLPTIGGRDTLPAFQNYRFTDNDSLLLRSELRWTASPLVDMAVFLDQGTVAARAGALGLHDVKRGWGIGARLHGPTFTALRLEAAHGVEGWRYNIAHSISF